MGNEAPGFPTPDQSAKLSSPPLAIRPNGVVLHDDLPVGTYGVADGLLTLNLGWCRLAGLSVRVEDDPQHDRHQTGLTLERLVERGV